MSLSAGKGANAFRRTPRWARDRGCHGRSRRGGLRKQSVPSPSGATPAGGATAPTAPAASQTLSETGSSLMAVLFSFWAPAYHSRFSQVTLRTSTVTLSAAQIAKIKG